ncbi:MAG: hypothetical protein M3346_00170 [Actinomycetota bacterium]|nr:hypothetical protein [Actinomycetota bacterium]
MKSRFAVPFGLVRKSSLPTEEAEGEKRRPEECACAAVSGGAMFVDGEVNLENVRAHHNHGPAFVTHNTDLTGHHVVLEHNMVGIDAVDSHLDITDLNVK